MSAKKKTWREKLANDNGLPKVITMDGKLSSKWGTGTCVVPAPREVDALMRTVKKGRLATIDSLRRALATKHGSTIACPITTGIFAWIAAHAANEAELEGNTKATPWWRTLKSGGELNPKYPGGIEAAAERLRDEGHTVFQKGKRWFVKDHEKSLAKW
ncbi:MAG TPA: methylated DNA-protein cysteine methyltransferase [Verrucomicrobiales bacterium]|nr:methylated DNA-protein cysteine methyltransferase [Verrucomicrobiales bacterium]